MVAVLRFTVWACRSADGVGGFLSSCLARSVVSSLVSGDVRFRLDVFGWSCWLGLMLPLCIFCGVSIRDGDSSSLGIFLEVVGVGANVTFFVGCSLGVGGKVRNRLLPPVGVAGAS